jgi:large subunit ribosomal protein L9
MKIILKQEVSGLGSAGDVVEVKPGYARNYLVPRGLATTWTRGAERQVASLRKARSARDIRDLGTAQDVRTRLEATPVTLQANAGSGGRLFGAVTPSDIAEAILAAGGPEVDRRRIEASTPIKAVGSHRVTVRLHPEVIATVQVEVQGS